jgi:hypothetical protein
MVCVCACACVCVVCAWCVCAWCVCAWCVCVRGVCVAGFLSGNGMPDGVPRRARHALFPKQVRRTLLLVPFVLGH